MGDWLQKIQANLVAGGQEPRVWKAADGRLLVLPHGARLVACDLLPGAGNLFWHDPGLESSATAGEKAKAAGANIGGDRLWLGPEIGLHWPSLKRARVNPWPEYFVPRAVDPGDYKIAEEGPGHLRLVNEARVTDNRGPKSGTVRMSREFTLIGPPEGLPRGLKSVSFAVTNQFTLLEADAGLGVGTWDLLQVPAGGWIICPTTVKVARPRIYYGKFATSHFKINDAAVRFKVDGRKQLKFGLDALRTTGRMGYYRKVGRQSVLIFRPFVAAPGLPYVDLPLTSDDLTGGDALQCYNDGGQFGGFGEMEYHDAALIAGKAPAQRTSTNVTHVLGGTDAAIRKAARLLLGVTV